jgi:hypothetical protein
MFMSYKGCASTYAPQSCDASPNFRVWAEGRIQEDGHPSADMASTASLNGPQLVKAPPQLGCIPAFALGLCNDSPLAVDYHHDAQADRFVGGVLPACQAGSRPSGIRTAEG